MNTARKILIVEDDMIIAADISMQLTKLNYEIVGICTKAEDALNLLQNTQVDLVLMDIVLSGTMDGIEAAHVIQEKHKTPLIFLTSNSDDATFNKAISSKPFAFISKPFNKSELARSIAITFQRIDEAQENEVSEEKHEQHVSTMDDRLFVRHKDKMEKVLLTDILYLQAERNYCHIYTEEKHFFLSLSLRSLESRLPEHTFIRVHRSYIVNLKRIDAISDNHEFLIMQSARVPISRRMKDDVIKRVNLV